MKPAAKGPYLQPGPALALKIALIFLLSIILIAVGVLIGRMRHEARRAQLELCAVELKLLEARSPFVATYLKPADPCLAVAVVRGGR